MTTVNVRAIVTDALVGMVSGVTGMVPPSNEPLPDFIQAPVDRAVERISAALADMTAERDALRDQLHVANENIEQLHNELNLLALPEQTMVAKEGV